MAPRLPSPVWWRRRTSRARQGPVQPAHQPSAHGEEPGRTPAWINSVWEKVNKAQSRFPKGWPTIFRVPENISRSNKAAYEPSVVCIGPLCLHNGYPTGCLKLKDCKWHFLRCLFSRCYENENEASRILDDCLRELMSRDADVRSCYSEDFPNVDPSELATMMLLDGSFIIYLLLWRLEEGDARSLQPLPDRLETPDGSAEQGSTNLTGQEEVSIVEKADKAQESRSKEQEKGKGKVMGVPESGLGSGLKPEPPPKPEPQRWQKLPLWQKPPPEWIQSRDVSESDSKLGSGSGLETRSEWVDLEIGGGAENFDWCMLGSLWNWHLIVYDLLKLKNQIPFFVIKLIHEKLYGKLFSANRLTGLALNLFSDIHPSKSKQFGTPPNEIHHLLHLLHWSIVTCRQVTQSEAQYEASTTPEWIPNATELALAGVKFKQKKSDCFLDISLKNGVLEIPLLRIYNYTNSLFRNLIAFEQCFPDMNMDITIYANFMDCIVDTANDVRLLNMKGILVHRLSTDDEVASLFNQLCYMLHCDPKKNYLKNLFVEVTKYHQSKRHQWRASLVRDYFTNPWVIISVLAAVLLLLLTIDQSFFATFSYFRPPNPSAPPPNS